MSEEFTFGSWLRQRRKELSITQEELAERLGISWIALRKLESGERHPSGQVALLLADYLRLPADEHQAFVAFARTGRQRSGEVSPIAPWRNAHARHTNLPAVLTPLIGRDQELTTARNHLLNSKVRLLSLIGPPGIGKTRLGLQVASNLVDQFEDGVYFVDLAPIMDPAVVSSAIARTLGLNETVDQSLENVLLDYLRQRRMLLLLDNFEQVLDASNVVVKLMEASPWLKVLVTSREALQVRGERRFVVPPLAGPDLNHLPPFDKLQGFPSVELFVERALAVAPDFTFLEANAQDVAAVCIGLEGLPLAIELAASLANRLTPAQMRLALTNRLNLLRAETRDLPTRQRTLRGAIEWSYDLLASEEQTLLRRLGVFVGGFTPDAVDAVCRSASERSEGSTAATVGVLYSLVDKSLLRKDVPLRPEGIIDSTGSADRETRFGMLEAIREYVEEKLRESEPPANVRDVEKKHALYFMTLAEEAEPYLKGPRQQEWLGILEDEHNNLSAALSWAWAQSGDDSISRKTVGAAEIGLRIAVALRHFWYIRGYFSEGREQLEAAIAHSAAPESSLEFSWSKTTEELQAVRARALEGSANLASELGDYASANARRQESLDIRRKIKDKSGIASSLNNLGIDAQYQGEYASARAFLEEALAVWRELENKQGMALALTNLGRAVFLQGEYETARTLHEQGLGTARQIGDKRGTALCLTNLGFVVYAQEKYDDARALYDEALSIERELGNRGAVATLLIELGYVSFMLNDYTAARALHEQGLAICREIGQKVGISYALHGLGLLAFAQGEPETARALLQESLGMLRNMDNKLNIASNLAGLGAVAASMESGVEETLRGARLLGASDALKKRLGAVWSPEDRAIFERGASAARDRLGEEAFEQAILEGHTFSMEEVVAYAQMA